MARWSLGLFTFFIVLGLAAILIPPPASSIEKEIRARFSEQLKPLPKIKYKSIIGDTPSAELVHLGRMLFNDPILSRNNDVSCATCHLSNHGFADMNNLTFGALGHGGPNGDNVGHAFATGFMQERRCGDDGFGFRCSGPMFRNTLSTVNVAYRAQRWKNQGLLWDGRFGDLKFQTLLPIHTHEELCGSNPVPLGEDNIFREGGPLFKKPVHIQHSHLSDQFSGEDLQRFHAPAEDIKGVPSIRPDGRQSVPNRNECLAIAIAKLRYSSKYPRLFEKAFGSPKIGDYKIGQALAAFVSTHVSKNTPYDKFVRGQNQVLSPSQLRGLVRFLGPPDGHVELAGEKIKTVGCNDCHSAPFFGGTGFGSLGVRSDPRSVLSEPRVLFAPNSFYVKVSTERGGLAQCHVEGRSASSEYGPDMGRAVATQKTSDCFQFRIPTLRNVIETYPYFHHGSERAIGVREPNLEKRALASLKKVVEYHLRGPINIPQHNRVDPQKQFFDFFHQMDSFVPVEYMQFFKDNKVKQVQLDEQAIDEIVDFIAYGLFDKNAVVRGDLGNDVSHPQVVPSGLSPSITRDHGHQQELPK